MGLVGTSIGVRNQIQQKGNNSLQLFYAVYVRRFAELSRFRQRSCRSQTLIKRWTMKHTNGPVQVLHYERPEKMSTPLTPEEIKKGWGNKAIDQVMNLTLEEIE